MGISGLTGSDHLRGLGGSRTLTGLHGRDHPTGLTGADHLRGLGAAFKSLRSPLFGDDPDFGVFIYERAAWLRRDGEEVEIDVDLALKRGIRIRVEGDEVVMLG